MGIIEPMINENLELIAGLVIIFFAWLVAVVSFNFTEHGAWAHGVLAWIKEREERRGARHEG